MTANDTLTGRDLRRAVFVSAFVGALVSAFVSVTSWIVLFGSPITIDKFILVLLIKAVLGFVIGLLIGLSVLAQFLLISAISVLTKRSELGHLVQNLTRNSALLGAFGGVIGGLLAGAISIPA